LDRKQLEQEFSNQRPIYSRIAEEAHHTLENGLKQRQIKFHSVTERVKEFSSFASKVDRRQSEKPFEDITDVVGLRIVCLLRSDIPRIAELIRQSFHVVTEDDRVETQPIAPFGYLSVHFIVRFTSKYQGTRYEGLHIMPFEIQVRTAAMDSWAMVSHYLDYKTEVDVPAELRKDFQALSALFYLADTHFEMFYKERQKSRDAAAKLFAEAPAKAAERPLDFDSLRSLLSRRYSARTRGSAVEISALLTELVNAGYESVANLESVLAKTEEAFAKCEDDDRRGQPNLTGYTQIGAVRISLDIGDRAYRSKRISNPAVHEKYQRYEKFVKGS
jgi:ppGpp synthetase/RelA/SpoT-type nucleotidyltranferase